MQEPLKVLDDELGGFGRFQKWVFFLVCFPPVMSGLSVVNQVFIGLNLPYRCAVPNCDFTEDSSTLSFQENFLNFTTPYDFSTQTWSSCTRFVTNSTQTNSSFCDPDYFDTSTTEECSQWVYDTSLFKSTLVTEFDLTCDRKWMQSLGGSAFMFGMPFGAVLLGYVADIIGRRKGLVVSLAVLCVGELVAALSVNYYMYLVMRFLSGAGCIAAFQNSIILVLEVVSSEWRTLCGMAIKVPFALGETSVAAFAYFIRDWRWLQFTLAIPPFFLLSYWWIMPESIRWLLSKGRYKEAKKLIKKAAKANKVVVSEDVYKALIIDETSSDKKKPEEVKTMSALDLFRSPRLRVRTFILIFSWIAITHNFYGLSSNSANFGGNIFVNFVAIMIIEVPSYIIAYLILDRLGRKGTLVLLLLTGGSACFVASMINEVHSLAIIVLSIGGKFCISAAFAVIYIYTIEIFPTQYRSLGLGTCSMSARIGGIIAPFTAGIGVYYRPLPLIVFGILSIICGSALMFLPETLGSELPQTLEESENYGVNQSIFYFTCFQKKKKEVVDSEEVVKLNGSANA